MQALVLTEQRQRITAQPYPRRQCVTFGAISTAGIPPPPDRKFADSPLEGTGFEPSVPLLRKGSPGCCRTKMPDRQAGWGHQAQVVSRDDGGWARAPLHGRPFDRGTDGSNPFRSSGEAANSRSLAPPLSGSYSRGTESSNPSPSSRESCELYFDDIIRGVSSRDACAPVKCPGGAAS